MLKSFPTHLHSIGASWTAPASACLGMPQTAQSMRVNKYAFAETCAP